MPPKNLQVFLPLSPNSHSTKLYFLPDIKAISHQVYLLDRLFSYAWYKQCIWGNEIAGTIHAFRSRNLVWNTYNYKDSYKSENTPNYQDSYKATYKNVQQYAEEGGNE